MNDTTTIGIIFVVIFTVAGLVAVILRSRSGILLHLHHHTRDLGDGSRFGVRIGI
jgi:hypothetical protein